MQPVSLYNRHNEVPRLSSRPGKVDALYYNHVQIALKHLGRQIRLHIPRLKHLDLILQKDAWIVVDITLSDIPVVAWTGFETRNRDNLHEPVTCEIRFFHFAASMILNRTLEAMELMLGELMGNEAIPQSGPAIIPLHKPED